MQRITRVAIATLALSAVGGAAWSFGTIRGLGQNAEHERITRRALACSAGAEACLQPRTLEVLAGGRGTFGAVGAPDRGRLTFQPRAHCDNGDHLDARGYPQSGPQAQGALLACRAWMAMKLDEAVADAGGLLDDQGRVRPGQTGLNCVFKGSVKGRAKCNVLEDMGSVLHAAQDFYSHTNWSDRADRSRAVGLDNPPGLGRAEPAAFISLRGQAGPPAGLISGCFGIPEARKCAGRVMHASLNKDTGAIDPAIGAGTTPRGRVEGNFARAVNAAVRDSREKWILLEDRLVGRYGPERGRRMACVLKRDDPGGC